MGFSFQTFGGGFGGPRGMKFDTQGGVNLEDLFRQAQRPPGNIVKYEITLNSEQAASGLDKDLFRKGRKLKVKIPAGVKTGSKVLLRNALKVTDGQSGDIVIHVRVK